ncbi:MAG: hypothetical protein RJA07_2147 [Bacteroidota bacterium]|jgi:hypothetical protein
MKRCLIIFILFGVITYNSNGQNLILNSGFENHWGGDCTNGSSVVFYDSLNVTSQFGCTIKDWIRISETPDGYWNKGHDFPRNSYAKYIYPHSDSVCVGGVFFSKLPNTTLREIIEGKLIKPLIADHHYQFSIYVQLFDTMHVTNAGKLVGINSFSAVFTDTMIPSHLDLPIQNYTPQVQINTMVTDTQHWVLLMDTFIAVGGEQFVSIGNFKTDAQTQFILVDSQSNLPEASYYYMDDVSLIDITPLGIDEVGISKIEVYPNPAKESIVVSSKSLVNTIEVRDVLGRVVIQQIKNSSTQQIQIDVSSLSNGLYFIKATDDKGNSINGKFVKE